MPISPTLKVSSKATLIALSIALVQLGSSAFATPGDEGIRQFHAKRYEMAVGHLERAASKNPNDPSIRYYIAGCYVHLNRHEEAARAYQTCYRLDPFGPLSGYCRRALIAYGRSIPVESEQAAMSKPFRQPEKIVNKLHQHNSPKHLEQAVDVLRRQTTAEKNRQKSQGDTLASNLIDSSKGTARKILDDAEAEIRAILEAPLPAMAYSANPYAAQQSKDIEMARRQELVATIRRKSEEDAARVVGDARDRSQKYKQFSADRQTALDEVADSLESQMTSSRLKDRVKMQAAGSGLYVRNFEVAPSPSPAVRPSVARIYPHENPTLPDEVKPDAVGENAGDRKKLPVSADIAPAEKSVSGKVLGPVNIDGGSTAPTGK